MKKITLFATVFIVTMFTMFFLVKNIHAVCTLGSDSYCDDPEDCGAGYNCTAHCCVAQTVVPCVAEYGPWNDCHTLSDDIRCGRGKACSCKAGTTGECDDIVEYCTCPGGNNPTATPAPGGGNCSKNEWDSCSGGTKRCVTRQKPKCADNTCGCYSNDCGDGASENCGGGNDPTATPPPNGNNPTSTPIPTPACAAQTFSSASVAPSTLRPLDQVTVRCNYGKRLDCLSVTGGGLANCRYSRYEGTDNIFSCDAGPNVGFYDDAKCVLKTGTTDNCCATTNKAGDMNILGTDVHYDQDIVLPFGAYTLSARVFSVISRGKGVRISLICNSDTCTTGIAKNGEVASFVFPEATDFASQSAAITLTGSGDDRHYLLRLSADKGSEAYFDVVSLKNAAQRELVANGDFGSTVDGSVSTAQPVGWGEGDNKIGYYYGSVADGGTNQVPPTQPPGQPTTTPGHTTSVSITLKIKLQGITKKPVKADSVNVQVKLAGGGLSAATAYKSFPFTVNDVGEWSGTASFDNIPIGGGYRLYVKGPKHIAKRICDASPTESIGGLYHCGDGVIVLQTGNNTFDFSKIVQMAGDLPESGGAQNGIIDAYDTTFIRTNLGSSDATKLAIGDLNLDGIIDTQDYSMILQSLSIKFDEE